MNRWIQLLLALGTIAPVVGAQGVVGGILSDSATRRPLPCWKVELVDRSGRPAAVTRTRLAGDFEFSAPSAGRYSLRFSAFGLSPVETPAESLDVASDSERAFRAPLVPRDLSQLAALRAETDTTEIPRLLPGRGIPRYPDRHRATRTAGLVVVGYAVSALGAVDEKSLVILEATHPEFAAAVRAALPKARFRPAQSATGPICVFQATGFEFRVRDDGIGLIVVQANDGS